MGGAKRRCGADDGTFFTLTHTHTRVCFLLCCRERARLAEYTHSGAHKGTRRSLEGAEMPGYAAASE